ncbi:tyrosine-type recombinase/integrase [Herminiimonas contaminans]|uniref:Site-specific integrase n=1 Tax=Herminiimonas contaminans TaxID=1111140 RepID=A0ABS0EY67_9BURK|nr:integrase [Herminiimonas contaminans]MBF8179760.1 site-specific integrase [Herminiimonas contaminans]
MATITKRGQYQWQAKIRREGHKQLSKTFNSKNEAEAWSRHIEGEMDRGIFVSREEAESTTLREGLERYANEITPLKKGAAQELTRIKRWQKDALGSRYLSNIRGSDLAKFRDERRSQGKAENTIRLDLALLSHFFETARKDWGMESLINPVKNISLPSGSKQRDRRLQPEEFQYLIQALNDGSQPIASSIVQIAVSTAMRQGEILGLLWENIDFSKRTIYLADTKNGESRTVPLSSKAALVLSNLSRPIDGGKVFYISQDRLIRSFQRACAVGKINYVAKCNEECKPQVDNFLVDLRFHDLCNPKSVLRIDSAKLIKAIRRYATYLVWRIELHRCDFGLRAALM